MPGGGVWSAVRLRLLPIAAAALALTVAAPAGAAFRGTNGEIAYEGRSELLLKWPNDILLAGEKVAGMLLENIGSTAENRSVVVIGTGINLANHPESLPQPAVSLAAYGMTITPAEALEVLAATTHEWLARWSEGNSFPSIRRAWLDRAGPAGRPLRVKINGEETEGVYGGLDADGALRLLTADGSEYRIAAGDVFFLSR